MVKFALELIGILIILTVLVRLLEPRFAFFPTRGETVTPREFGLDYEPLTIMTRDGERLRGWSLRHPAPRAHIIYFHGNGGNLSVWAPILAAIARRGYSVLAFDYRGYGHSSGRPTERGLYRDVDAVVERFWSGSQRGAPVVYWGRSLGVAMAAYATTVGAGPPARQPRWGARAGSPLGQPRGPRTGPDGLILESGFPDARSLVRTSLPLAFFALFSTYRFPSAEFIQRLSTPVLVMHGDDDHVVPIAQGRALFERIGGPKRFVTIRGGDHNDLTPREPDAYWHAVDRFVASLSEP